MTKADIVRLLSERIDDITQHPQMKGPINARALCYALYNHPDFKDLLTIEEDGDRYLFLWNQPKTAEELIRRRDIYTTCMRWGAAMSGMGPDALAASGIVTAKMDKELGTNYTEAVEDYRQHLRDTDPAITGAITDVKGNRGLRPSAQTALWTWPMLAAATGSSSKRRKSSESGLPRSSSITARISEKGTGGTASWGLGAWAIGGWM